MGSTSSLACLLQYFHFYKLYLAEDFASLGVFLQLGFGGFAVAICFILSSAFDYVTFELFYHCSLPFFFHYEEKNKMQSV